MQQLRAWMAAPVPASQMESWFRCNPVDYSAEGARVQGMSAGAVGHINPGYHMLSILLPFQACRAAIVHLCGGAAWPVVV